jgi:hypothetical protein
MTLPFVKRTDIYSLGIILERITRNSRPPGSKMDTIINSMLSITPSKRPTTTKILNELSLKFDDKIGGFSLFGIRIF